MFTYLGGTLCLIGKIKDCDESLNISGVHYGSHSWHWYLSQGLPPLLGPLLLPLLTGLRNAALHILLPLLVKIVFLSLLPHKVPLQTAFIQYLL